MAGGKGTTVGAPLRNLRAKKQDLLDMLLLIKEATKREPKLSRIGCLLNGSVEAITHKRLLSKILFHTMYIITITVYNSSSSQSPPSPSLLSRDVKSIAADAPALLGRQQECKVQLLIACQHQQLPFFLPTSPLIASSRTLVVSAQELAGNWCSLLWASTEQPLPYAHRPHHHLRWNQRQIQ